jgi:hypothetical protein
VFRHQRDMSEAAWLDAVSAHAHLMAGGRLEPVPVSSPGLLPEPGEQAVGVFERAAGVSMAFARYSAADIAYSPGRTAVIMGSPHFLIGFALGSIALRTRARRQARRAATAQWRPTPLLCLVLTSRRLWCEVAEPNGTRWLNFNYDTITGLELTHRALTMTFTQSEPLRLVGDWAPWCAAVIAHYRYGPSAGALLPAPRGAPPFTG